MSLINKMLQDLDARGSLAGPGVQADVRPVAARERRVPLRALVIGSAGTVALVVAGAGWLAMHRQPVPPVPAAVAPQLAAAAPAPVAAAAPAPAIAAVPAAPPPVPVAAIQAAPPAPPHMALPAPAHKASPAPKTALHAKQQEVTKKSGSIGGKISEKPAAAVAAAKSAPAAEQGKQVNAMQRAENEYRHALLALQEGRVSESITALQQALAIEPHHEAARETLIRLLLEGKRPDEAMRQMQLGLGLDPKQPAMAMMLARMQVEQGGPAAETLLRTLPFATANADYQAFLAGVLQREQRHEEAAAHYEQALRIAPQNGVWWMGLGISLQAGQRLPEAKDAFMRARAAPAMTPELQAFIERKLQQLAR